MSRTLPTLNSEYWLRSLVLLGVFSVSMQVGFLFPFASENSVLIWPASAVALTGLLLSGWHYFPAISAGALLVSLLHHDSPLAIFTSVAAFTIEPLLAAYLLNRFRSFQPQLQNFADVRDFLIYAILISPLVGATIATLGSLSTAADPFTFGWHWWISHAMSIATISPILLTVCSPQDAEPLQGKWWEFFALLGLLMLVSFLVFLRLDVLPVGNYPLGHMVFPFLLWIAIRFSPREVAAAGFVTALIATLGTIQKTGPFSRPDVDTNLILLGTFVFSVIVMALMLSSIISQWRLSNRRLLKSQDLLEQRVQERTNALNDSNQIIRYELQERTRIAIELEEARDEAVKALEIKNQILANVSHDARTPISIIMLYAEMMQRTNQGRGQEELEYLDIIYGNAIELSSFFNNLVNAARMQSDSLEPHYKLVDLQQTCKQVVKSLELLAARKQLSFQFQIDDRMPARVITDPEWLKQIIMNLGSNAIKFTERGQIEMYIGVLDDQRWLIRVQDTGIGIPLEGMPHIFKPFWQVDSSSTRKANRGVGLGLSLVYGLVQKLNGNIKVESYVDQGSTFAVRFALLEEVPDEIRLGHSNY
jgi:signal transduction histidine kinase